MKIDWSILNQSEQIGWKLRSCYRSYGYTQFKMRKFEEYDLYVRNKDFLVSDNVITFNDCNGKLMALKPDVTLSIVRSGRDVPGGVQRVYYNENVYRVSDSSVGFREIMQAGLECIGEVDDYMVSEVVTLACRSLRCIREQAVLYLSHLDIVSERIDALGVNDSYRQEILQCIAGKNLHELSAVCRRAGADAEQAEALRRLVLLRGKPETVLPALEAMGCGSEAAAQLGRLVDTLRDGGYGDMVQIDFSLISDMAYYNGIVCKGYVEGVPVSVLSGGQYDRLMKRMGRSARAIGFAVYLDALERLDCGGEEFDTDMVIVYDDKTDRRALSGVVKRMAEQGIRVTALRRVPEKLRYRQLVNMNGSEVQISGENA